jgi:hypothetical protein
MDAPKLPPFAGAIVNFDRRGERVVACVDRSVAPKPGAPVTPPPAVPTGPRQVRIWVIEREVMQELLTTGGLCDARWSPDGTRFVAAGPRGVFAFTAPQYQPEVIVAGKTQSAGPTPPDTPSYAHPVWSPSGARVAFAVTGPSPAVQVVVVKTGERILDRAMTAKTLAWGDSDRALLVDGAKVAVP